MGAKHAISHSARSAIEKDQSLKVGLVEYVSDQNKLALPMTMPYCDLAEKVLAQRDDLQRYAIVRKSVYIHGAANLLGPLLPLHCELP